MRRAREPYIEPHMHLQDVGCAPAKPLEAVSFATEEASRFSVPCLGRWVNAALPSCEMWTRDAAIVQLSGPEAASCRCCRAASALLRRS